jgi:ADP-heptose:LPS heptosyltransferase
LIGDVILTSPLVDLLKKQWPEVKIDFLVNRGTGEFLKSDPRINAVMFNEKKGALSLSSAMLLLPSPCGLTFLHK